MTFAKSAACNYLFLKCKISQFHSVDLRPKKGIGLGRSPIDWVGDYIGTNEAKITREKSNLLGYQH